MPTRIVCLPMVRLRLSVNCMVRDCPGPSLSRPIGVNPLPSEKLKVGNAPGVSGDSRS